MTKTHSGAGKAALVIGHVAGMIDLVALPLWVDTLILGYKYSPAQAGALPTLFLIGAVIASVVLSRRFHAINGRGLVPLGFAIAAVSFFVVTKTDSYVVRAGLHLLSGIAAGTSVSIIHGTMGKTDQPHRVFAMAGIGLGLFAILFLGGMPQIITAVGPQAFFYGIGGTMAIAAVVTAALMPSKAVEVHALEGIDALPLSVKYAIVGVMGMALVQGMVFSILVQVGNARGFGSSNVEIVLIVLGFISLSAPVLAAFLEKRLSAMTVARVGPVVQAAFATAIMTAPVYLGYAVPAVFFAAVMIFTHTFVFGFMARQDPTGRAVAATPAIVMSGAAIGPFLGGALVELSGYPAIGIAAIVIAVVCIVMFTNADRTARAGGTAAGAIAN